MAAHCNGSPFGKHLAIPGVRGWLLLVLVCFQCSAATNDPILTVARVVSGEFQSSGYASVEWRSPGPGYYFWESNHLVYAEPETESKEVVIPSHLLKPAGQSAPLQVASFEFSKDGSRVMLFTNTRRVWRQNNLGDYWVLDISARELKKLGGDAAPSSLSFAKFSPDGTRAAFVRERNIYVQDLRTMKITALTSDGSGDVINGTFDWVYEEELDLRDGFRWSPDSKQIAYWQLDTSGVREFVLINQTDSLYPQTTTFKYPKAGGVNSAGRIGVIPVEGGQTRWLEIPGDPREHYLARMEWAPDSNEILVQQFNRLQNTNLVFMADAVTGRTRRVLTEWDEAWVDNLNAVQWLKGGQEFFWLSERSGWRHAYRVSRDGKKVRAITRGKYDVISVEGIDQENGWLYFMASPRNATQRYLYRAPLDGGRARRLSPREQAGTHRYSLSADFQYAIHTFSSRTNPPVTQLVRLPDHSVVRVLEKNERLREKIAALEKPATEFFRVEIGGGVALDGWSLTPPRFNPAKKYPVLFHVYGEPAGQTVIDRWWDRTGMWHWMLAQQGYVVMSVDNRGTPAPRGREWRKSIYRQVGILNAGDQAKAVAALLEERPYLDPERVGIWGWSGGGSSTLNAMLQYPDIYTTGVAVAAVPNQRHYDTIYQERYMGLPQDNPEGYRQGSPITHAARLKGNLLIVHGTGDDNVHYQGAEALANELIYYNKPFTIMPYPNRSHGIGEGHNTTRHLFELITRYLHQHLPPGPVNPKPPVTPRSGASEPAV